MGTYVNRGNSSFASARRSQIYIDKTGLLNYANSVLDTEQSYICVSRARRFGKTLTAGMLTAYYSKGCNSEALFRDLTIAKSSAFKEQLNQYDVIIHLGTKPREDLRMRTLQPEILPCWGLSGETLK